MNNILFTLTIQLQVTQWSTEGSQCKINNCMNDTNTKAPYSSSMLIQAEYEVCPKLWYVQSFWYVKSFCPMLLDIPHLQPKRLTSSRWKEDWWRSCCCQATEHMFTTLFCKYTQTSKSLLSNKLYSTYTKRLKKIIIYNYIHVHGPLMPLFCVKVSTNQQSRQSSVLRQTNCKTFFCSLDKFYEVSRTTY